MDYPDASKCPATNQWVCTHEATTADSYDKALSLTKSRQH